MKCLLKMYLDLRLSRRWSMQWWKQCLTSAFTRITIKRREMKSHMLSFEGIEEFITRPIAELGNVCIRLMNPQLETSLQRMISDTWQIFIDNLDEQIRVFLDFMITFMRKHKPCCASYVTEYLSSPPSGSLLITETTRPIACHYSLSFFRYLVFPVPMGRESLMPWIVDLPAWHFDIKSFHLFLLHNVILFSQTRLPKLHVRASFFESKEASSIQTPLMSLLKSWLIVNC